MDSQFPITLLRDLPQYTGTLSTGTQFIAVLNNETAVRVAWNNLSETMVSYSPVTPTSPASDGDTGQITHGDGAVFTYYNGEWRKSPAYSKNWADIDKNTRFLDVSRVMVLSDEEVENLRAMLQIGIATNKKEGLVKGWDEDEEGSLAPKNGAPIIILPDGTVIIPPATENTYGAVKVHGSGELAASKEYVDNKFAELNLDISLPTASQEQLGGVKSGGDVSVDSSGVMTVRRAYAGNEQPGIVTVADENEDSQTQSVVPLWLLRSIIATLNIPKIVNATTISPGYMMPAAPLKMVNGTATGEVTVADATTTTTGVVRICTVLPTEVNDAVPTAKAVIQYITNLFNPDENGEGGISFKVDQAYSPVSENAQSGKAVQQALQQLAQGFVTKDILMNGYVAKNTFEANVKTYATQAINSTIATQVVPHIQNTTIHMSRSQVEAIVQQAVDQALINYGLINQ